MSLKLITPAALEPVSVPQLKLHARILRDDEDSLIQACIIAARRYAETVQRRQLVTATWRLTLDAFPTWTIRVPLPPLATIVSIQYVDNDGATQTISAGDYLVDANTEPGRVTPAYGKVWPTPRCQANAVTVNYTAGYGTDPASVPETTRQAIKLLAAHWYENREAVVVGTISGPLPLAVDALLACESYGGYAIENTSEGVPL